MKKIFNKKAKATIKFCLAIGLIFSIVFFNLYTSNLAMADSPITAEHQLEGDRTSAHKKLYFDALLQCSPLSEISSANLQKIKEGKTFMNGGTLVESGLYIDVPGNEAYSYWLETKLTGNKATIDGGKFRCSQDNGKLAHDATLNEFQMGFTQKQLICGDGNAGLYEAKVSGYYCEDLYDENKGSGWSGDETKVKSRSEWKNFLYDLAREKTFGGSTPPGGYVDHFTNLETYYIYEDAFFTACAEKTPRSEGMYKIKTWDSATKSFKEAHYSAAADGVGPDDKIYLWSGKRMTCQEIANAMNDGSSGKAYQEYMIREASDPTTPDPDPGGPSDPEDPGSSDPTCLTEAGSLGWIACPTAESMGSFAKNAYESMVEDYLKVEASLLSGDDGGTFDAWKVFRDIANIGFIIVLLIIIFSQLTGFGIDNYGIKKTLPKLIITALLINASYLICQAAVDISNIVGSSAKDLLETIAGGVGGTYDIGKMVKAVLGAVGIGGTVAVATFIGGGLWAILLPLLLGLLSVVIAIIFAFFLLGMRKALIIVFVVISPVALLLYALPNTKKIFDKWFKVFKAMLLLYPA